MRTSEYRTAWQDGSQPARKMFSTPRSLPIDVAWLADGRPVTIFLGVGPVGGLEARMWVYDWLADLRAPLPPGVSRSSRTPPGAP